MPGYYKYYHQTPTLYVPTSLLSPHCRVLSNDGQAIRVSLKQHCTSANLLKSRERYILAYYRTYIKSCTRYSRVRTYHSSISLPSLAAMLNEHLVGGCDQINSFIKIRGVKLQQPSSYSRLLFFGLLPILG